MTPAVTDASPQQAVNPSPPLTSAVSAEPGVQALPWWALREARARRVTAAVDAHQACADAALGAAGAGRAAARAATAAAEREMWLLGGDPADPPVAWAIDDPGCPEAARVRARRTAALTPWLGSGLPAALEAFTVAAPGPAGGDPRTWLGRVGDSIPGPSAAQLWRIGTASVPGVDCEFPAAIPLLGHRHLHVTSTAGARAQAEAATELLLLRVLSAFRPGQVRLHVWDVARQAGTLPGLYGLAGTDLLSVTAPDRLSALLADTAARISRVQTGLLAAGHRSVTAADTAGASREPWSLLVLVGDGVPWRDEDVAVLQRIARGGVDAGVHLVLIDVPVQLAGPTEHIRVDPTGAVCTTCGPFVRVRLDTAAADSTGAASAAIAAEWERWRNRPASFADLLPRRDLWGGMSADEGVCAPAGFDEDGEQVLVELGDGAPHALVCGPTGSGKTNFLLAWTAAITTRYSPDEVELYLLDFKEGVSFAPLADPDGWLPHARLVGTNVNADLEFGLALLLWLSDELRRRAEVSRRVRATKLSQLRAKDPGGRWPRIVVVIDEFQVLLSDPALSGQVRALLDDLARRGRGFGIHLVLATQDLSSIPALWGFQGILEQFVLRIALPGAKGVLAGMNDAAQHLARWHAIINHQLGEPHGNVAARVPNAVADGTFDQVQADLHAAWPTPPPTVFDGAEAPALSDLAGRVDGPAAVVGQTAGMPSQVAAVGLAAQPGRNLAVLGGPRTAPWLLAGAAHTAAAGWPGAQVWAAVPAGQTVPAANWLVGAAAVPAVLDADLLAAAAARLDDPNPDRPPLLLVLFGAPDDSDPASSTLQRLLHAGPAAGVHVLGWWQSPARLRSLLLFGAGVDDIGSWVAVDVPGAELGSLIPGNPLCDWAHRPGRALWLDRAHSTEPTVIVTAEVGR